MHNLETFVSNFKFQDLNLEASYQTEYYKKYTQNNYCLFLLFGATFHITFFLYSFSLSQTTFKYHIINLFLSLIFIIPLYLHLNPHLWNTHLHHSLIISFRYYNIVVVLLILIIYILITYNIISH